ncbi:MFS transporter [Terribacillus saccharophilus]|uniref:MFS transporter n=1 Tax=Terribacillus saccharophilus TaxID=361277 RepID=A0ABX4H2W7_9BACI|nr:MFS transporter [Terribacillus saccharophilus]PAD37126.1 MFS transporter [Terribacillus saccharophilus]PAD97415.1 MFS transporter [Terribacillus saccharophilus]PAE01463.1 MFS transporter [Terribacillus saccharophilus]
MARKTKVKFGMILPIVLITYFLILLDNSIIFTGTVKIAQDLSLDARSISWVSNAYALTFGGLLLAMGRAGDIFGRKKIFIIGLVLFGLGSLAVGLSQDSTSIILARAFQGIGSSILAPSTLALIMDAYEGKMRTRAIIYYGATAGIGSSFGLIIGGVIASQLSWRDGFLINVPLALILALLSIRFVPKSVQQSGKIDVLGGVLSILAMTSLVYGIVGESYHQLSLIAALILFVFFISYEAKVKTPLMSLKIFADKERSGAYLARFLFMGAMLSYWFLTPQAMQNGLHFTPLLAGFAFLPMTIPQFLFGVNVAKLTEKFGNATVLIVGIFITLLGISLGIFTNLEQGYILSMALPMLLLGIGQGLALSPLTVAGVAHTSKDISGAASGVVNTVHQLGGTVGLSLVVVAISSLSEPDAIYHLAKILIGIFVLLSLVVAMSFILPGEKRTKA